MVYHCTATSYDLHSKSRDLTFINNLNVRIFSVFLFPYTFSSSLFNLYILCLYISVKG